MIQLAKMTPEECAAYVERGMIEYAEEHIKNGMSPEVAHEMSKKTYDDLLPDGVDSKDQYIFTIKNGDEAVGMLWFADRDWGGSGQVAFVYDVFIYEDHRRKGYGSQAFELMEDKVRELGLNSIRLHVFGHNQGAVTMYQNLGYESTNIHMEKIYRDRNTHIS